MRHLILTALLASGMPLPNPSDEPDEPPAEPADEAPGAGGPIDDVRGPSVEAGAPPVYEETAKHPTKVDPR